MRMFRPFLFALSFLLAAGAASAAEEATIVIDNFVFTPMELHVKPGTKITFVNHDDLPHNVVGENGAFRSKALDTDERFARVFDTPGEFLYFCGLHPQMKGRIVVAP
jgi:plastocyanin